MNPFRKAKAAWQIWKLWQAIDQEDWSKMKNLNWKTYTGAALVAASGVLEYLGYVEIAKLIMAVGGSLGLIGVRHAISKATDGK